MLYALVRGRNSGTWGWCPHAALDILGRTLAYDDPDEATPYKTAEAARRAILRDDPSATTIIVEP